MSRLVAVTMPKWGIEMQEGTLTAWNFAVGQEVAKGAGLFDVETEKIVNSAEAPASGTLRRILVQPGGTFPVGALLAVLGPPQASEAEVDAFVAGFKPANTSFEPDAKLARAASATAPAPVAPVASAATGGRSRASPIAERLAAELGVDLAEVRGTGRNGRISREDVEAFVREHGKRPAANANEPVRERLSAMRLAIGRRLAESVREIPHYRLSVDVDCGALDRRRAQLAAAGTAVSLNDLLLKACAETLQEHPDLNSHVVDGELLRFPRADVCVVVATESGLVTPVVRDAGAKPVERIAAEARDLAARARAGRLTREEITGGTFTLSNLGMFGIDRFDAIINPPQVAILAVGAASERVVARDGAAAVARVMTLELSCDHRIVDGAKGAAFLAALRRRLEQGDR
jgi:pyruvate dehydrogenase E2 component (dihydrolipoamide acetyltransferase)